MVHSGEVSVCVAHTGYQIVLLLSAIEQSSDFYKYCFSLNFPVVPLVYDILPGL